jgi:hypothetical protein
MPSNYTQYGDQDYVFGFDDAAASAIAAAIGVKPQTLSVSGTPEFTAEGKNIDGMTEAFVVGDQKFSFTMSGFLVDKALFDAASLSFTYDGRFYIVTDRKRDISNVDFQKAELTGVSFILIES